MKLLTNKQAGDLRAAMRNANVKHGKVAEAIKMPRTRFSSILNCWTVAPDDFEARCRAAVTRLTAEQGARSDEQ